MPSLKKHGSRAQTIKKGRVPALAGHVCKHGGFIVKGAMRQYSLDDKGAETHHSSLTGELVGGRQGNFENKLSHLII